MNTSVVLTLLVLSAATLTQPRSPPIGIKTIFAFCFFNNFVVFQRIAIVIRMEARPKDVMLMDNVIANVRSRALIVLNALIFTMDFQTVKKTVSLIFIKNY